MIRPMMEYADVIWDGCNEDDSELMESVQYEAARVVTGAMRGTSRSRLLHEVAWEEMKIRQKLHKLVCYFKIKNRLVPSCLSELLPCTVGQRTQISLRTSENLSIHPTRTERFKKSFFPSTTRLWNEIELDIRKVDSLNVFKNSVVNYLSLPHNTQFDFSLDRYSSILHTRLRLNCCALNYYLFRINCVPYPGCICGFQDETINHYFLYCLRFAAPRQILLSSVAQYLTTLGVTCLTQRVNLLLFGSSQSSFQENIV